MRACDEPFYFFYSKRLLFFKWHGFMVISLVPIPCVSVVSLLLMLLFFVVQARALIMPMVGISSEIKRDYKNSTGIRQCDFL